MAKKKHKTYKIGDKIIGGKFLIVRVDRYESGSTKNKKYVLSCLKCGKRKSVSSRYFYRTKCDCEKLTGERDTEEYKEWRSKVYQRDRFKCVCCGKGGWLNAHHLNGWAWAISERYIVSNGVTMCTGKKGCHTKFHDIYGKGKNTRQQFQEFLKKYYKKEIDKDGTVSRCGSKKRNVGKASSFAKRLIEAKRRRPKGR